MAVRPEETLLDAQLKEYENESSHDKFNLRLFFVTKLVQDANKEELKAYLNDVYNESKLFGMSLLYPGASIHLIQGFTEQAMELLRRLVREKDTHGMWPIRILISTDHFPPEGVNFLQVTSIDTMKQDFFPANVALEVSIAGVYNAILSLVDTLSKMTEHRRQEAISNLIRNYFRQLPSDTRVLGFAENEELCLIEEYLEIYDAPVKYTPVLETIWPQQSVHDLAIIERLSEMDNNENGQTNVAKQ